MSQYIVSGLILAVAVLFGGFGMLAQPPEVSVQLRENTTAEDSTFVSVRVSVDSKLPVNVIGGTILYPADIVSVEIERNPDSAINVWITEPTISAPGEITFAGGTNTRTGILTNAELFVLKIATSSDAEARFYFSKIDAYASDGQGTKLRTVGEDFFVNKNPVANDAVPGGSSSHSASAGGNLTVLRSDFNEDGEVNIGDLSIFMVKILMPYEERFDVNADSKVNVDDLSILLSALGKRSDPAIEHAQ